LIQNINIKISRNYTLKFSLVKRPSDAIVSTSTFNIKIGSTNIATITGSSLNALTSWTIYTYNNISLTNGNYDLVFTFNVPPTNDNTLAITSIYLI
jgi:hypothetical protein